MINFLTGSTSAYFIAFSSPSLVSSNTHTKHLACTAESSGLTSQKISVQVPAFLLNRSYGNQRAILNLSFSVHKREIMKLAFSEIKWVFMGK